jgi:hypothetical protein
MTSEQRKRCEELATKFADLCIPEIFSREHPAWVTTYNAYCSGYESSLADCAESERVAVEALEIQAKQIWTGSYEAYNQRVALAKKALIKLKGKP